MKVQEKTVWEIASPLPLTEIREKKRDILNCLQRVADDRDLQIIDINSRSETDNCLVVQSRASGYQRIRTLWKTMQLTNILGIPLTEVGKATPHQTQHYHASLEGVFLKTDEGTASDRAKHEEQIYNHLIDCVHKEAPEAILDRFRHLFIEGSDYPDASIQRALERVANAKDIEDHFNGFLYHCCHLLIDYWQRDKHCYFAINKLLDFFSHLPNPGFKQARGVRRLRQLVHDFPESKDYQCLQQLIHVIIPPKIEGDPKQFTLKLLLRRYPFLYKTALLHEGSNLVQRQTVTHLYEKQQHKFEFRLQRFVAYQVNLARIAQARQLSSGAGRIIRREKNPTLLRDRKLAIILRTFCTKPEDNYSYRKLAQRLMARTEDLAYGEFKNHLYLYLVNSLDSDYAKSKFKPQLEEYLQNTLSRYDTKPTSESLVMRTVKKLLDFLVVDSPTMDHYFFIDMVTGMGSSSVLVVLLKLILLHPAMVSELEKRFALLYTHYENVPQNEVKWFIKVLEVYKVVYSIHFGHADLSALKALFKEQIDEDTLKQEG
ncbi:hypothetical protein PN462_21970 [Spirulina sp. CS-785/01]|uniref:hypothetical protein n=1 Tax=Spirulina sp. CS-785/01 TaxID=3021716 RepID=UPI00232B308C|nr:hypothetical protein [Spirulina sp. CS-785/01]MDB9315797.1 hypothetical protein [Spirulina sp. CS-785/01]